MSPHIALLRGVNVGGRKVLKDDLLGLAKDLGFDDAKTLLASGNLVLWGKGGSDADIESAWRTGWRSAWACAPSSSSARRPS
jgi:uncharacterized protein (DUF1697 family)